MADHLDNIVINISLDPAPQSRAGFGVPMIIADGATSSLDGDRIRAYATPAAAQADQTAGFLSAAMLAAVVAAFSQRIPPALVKVGRKDALETYGEALPLIIAADPDFFGICIESRAAADQLLIAPLAEADPDGRIFILQSSDTDWKTAGLPAAYTALAGAEQSGVIYHDTDAQWSDFAWLANRLVFDPDSKSAPWDAAVQGVTGLASAPSATEKGHLDDNHCNHGLPYGAETFFVDAGVNVNGRPLHEIVTAAWFKARLREQVTAVKTAASARGDKIVIGPSGQGQILAEIAALFQRGVNASHFVAGQTTQFAEPITDVDLDLQRLRFGGSGQVAGSARLFEFNFNFSRSPIFEETA
jgi:hypothetical protein